jgi:hypothetical protein
MRILLLWINDAGVKTCHADLGSARVPVFGAARHAGSNPAAGDDIVWHEKNVKVQGLFAGKTP